MSFEEGCWGLESSGSMASKRGDTLRLCRPRVLHREYLFVLDIIRLHSLRVVHITIARNTRLDSCQITETEDAHL